MGGVKFKASKYLSPQLASGKSQLSEPSMLSTCPHFSLNNSFSRTLLVVTLTW